MKWGLCGLSAVALLCVAAGHAAAYSYESAVGSGCHERITMGSLRLVRTQLPTAPVLPAGSDLTALISDLPFTLDPDMRDVSAASLLVGVRDNDLKGRGPAEVDQLAEIHGNPANQREHCLRAPGDDEPSAGFDAGEPSLGWTVDGCVMGGTGQGRWDVQDDLEISVY